MQARGRAASHSQSRSTKPWGGPSGWPPSHRSSPSSGVAAITTSLNGLTEEGFTVCLLQERTKRQARGSSEMSSEATCWSGWAGIRTWVCLTVDKDTRDKAGLGATERNSADGTAEKTLGRTKFIPPEREVWPGPGSDACLVHSKQATEQGKRGTARSPPALDSLEPPPQSSAEGGGDLRTAPPSQSVFSGIVWRSQAGGGGIGSLGGWVADLLGVSNGPPKGGLSHCPSGQKARVPTAGPGATSPCPTLLCAPLRPSCLTGHSRALQASSDFPANPPLWTCPEISMLPSVWAPGHQRLQLTVRLSASTRLCCGRC